MSHLSQTLIACLALAAAASSQVPDIVYSGAATDDAWGTVVELVGDVNADGVRDYAIGSPDVDFTLSGPFPDAGRVEVRSGADGSLLRFWFGDLGGLSRFGSAIADAGDVNGDGHDDVLVGAPRANGAAPASGVVYLYSGKNGVELLHIDGPQTNGRFGHSLATGRDADGDGLNDFVIGAPHHDIDDANGGFGQEGAVSIHASDGTLIEVSYGTTITTTGPSTNPTVTERVRRHWGWAVALDGDLDDDGKTDVIATAPLTRVLTTDASGTPLPPQEDTGFWRRFDVDSLLDGGAGAAGSRLGWSLASLGAVGSDPGASFALGAPTAAPFGKVYGITAIPGTGLTLPFAEWGGTSQASIGEVIANVGDWDGDAIPDLAFGSPSADYGSPFTILDSGLVQIYKASSTPTLLAEFHGTTGDRIGAAIAGGPLADGAEPSLLIGAPEIDSPFPDAGAVWFYDGGTWYDEGGALAGLFGDPLLEGTGSLATGSANQVDLSNAAPAAFAGVFLALGPVSPVSFKGGTLQAFPFFKLLFLTTTPSGTRSIPFVMPSGVPAGAALWIQFAIQDAAAINGVALSNALRGATPP